MRHQLAVGAVLVLAVSACGASSEELRRAKAATYVGSPLSVFARAVAATREHYQIGAIDCSKLELVTNVRDYDQDGAVETPGDRSGGVYGNYIPPGGTVSYYSLDFYVRVVRTTDQRLAVKVSPRVWTGRPPTYVQETDETADPEFPSFARERADVLRLKIDDYETQASSAPDPCRQVAAGRDPD